MSSSSTNIGTGNGEPVLAPPTRPGEALTEFGELVGQTFFLGPEILGLFLVAVVLLIVALQAVMSAPRIQRMAGDIGRNDTELLAAYLARNKRTEDLGDAWAEKEHAQLPEDFEAVFKE